MSKSQSALTRSTASSTPTPTSITNPNPLFITAYGPKKRALLHFPPTEGRTKQSHKDECDINRIMARSMLNGGVIDFVNKYEMQYADVTAVDYQEAMNQVALAQSMFHDLPSQIRNRFENRPELFLDFVQNPANKAEAHALGLLRPDYDPNPPAQPDPVRAPSQAKSEAPKPDK